MGSEATNARYDSIVLRRRALGRYSLLTILLWTGCGAAVQPQPTMVRSEPLPRSENQQGHPAPLASVAALDAASDAVAAPLPPEEPSIAGVYLWCQDPRGRACALATAALGTGPKELSGLPTSLSTVEDLENDCEEPTIATVSGRLAHAFAIQPSGWRDQGGSYLDTSLFSDMYQAAGCINDADTSRPIAKISAASGASPRVYLVRVWDSQPAEVTY